MPDHQRQPTLFFAFFVTLMGWCIPGSGFFLLNERKRSVIIFVTICLTFAVGLYIGSVAIVDPENEKICYIFQMLNSPFVALLGSITTTNQLSVFGKSAEIGQIYTEISGMLNLLCIVNTTYLAWSKRQSGEGRQK